VVAGHDDRAASLVDAQRRALRSHPHTRAPQRVVVVVGTEPLVVAGLGSFSDDAVRALGATSAIRAGDPAWPTWSLESFVGRDVDVVVAAEGPDAEARLKRLLAPLGPRAPRLLVPARAILVRPGPSFAADVIALEGLLFGPAGGAP
jgi:ABC-type Fe3+-hydroxamate transport system substrate-binding protein